MLIVGASLNILESRICICSPKPEAKDPADCSTQWHLQASDSVQDLRAVPSLLILSWCIESGTSPDVWKIQYERTGSMPSPF